MLLKSLGKDGGEKTSVHFTGYHAFYRNVAVSVFTICYVTIKGHSLICLQNPSVSKM